MGTIAYFYAHAHVTISRSWLCLSLVFDKSLIKWNRAIGCNSMYFLLRFY